MPQYVANPELRTVICEIEPPHIQPRVIDMMRSEGFDLKDEFHITVVPREAGEGMWTPTFEKLAGIMGRALLLESDYTYSHDLYRVRKPKLHEEQTIPRSSIVAPVVSQRILQHIDFVGMALDAPLRAPFLHVTLATHPDHPIARRGIGIPSEEDWLSMETQVYASGWQA